MNERTDSVKALRVKLPTIHGKGTTSKGKGIRNSETNLKNP